jgi:hypothetical protein
MLKGYKNWPSVFMKVTDFDNFFPGCSEEDEDIR